ncbi:MAG: MBL fold metallo-hydrolase [Candidatus Pacebacteria bacterium]|nr:MBL fold metallo-hydrolase [Candidatus Paceibacterota bacterium]MBP9700783.1 MBL fold metallo-hydrolase [Candidatus Paceibacterota bacterium]
MKLTKFEQSGFILETENGFRLAFDIGNKTPLEKLEGIAADAMLISHIHGDHFSLDQIKKINPKKLYLNHECIETLGEESLTSEIVQVKVGDLITIGNITVQFFNVDHGPNVSVPLQENFGFLITADSQKIYFAGDMFYESGIDVTNFEVHYALLPVGTHYTFGPREAFEFAKKFKKIGKIISMHYANKPETQGEFLELARGSFEAE